MAFESDGRESADQDNKEDDTEHKREAEEYNISKLGGM